METVVAYPGNMAHAQNAALALLEAKSLQAFVTSFAWDPDGHFAKLLARIPLSSFERLGHQLKRRSITTVPTAFVHCYPGWEIVRSLAKVAFQSPIPADRAWDRMSHSFDAKVARRYVPRTQAIVGFEYTALAAFDRARELGVARILHLPSLDSRQFEELRRRERSRWPELRSRHDAYFEAKFERRYARRRREIELADVIVCNSRLTAESHIVGGADPERIIVVPLGAPPAIVEVRDKGRTQQRALRVICAGAFSLGKGAHYLVEAWRRLDARDGARLAVYGSLQLPQRLLAEACDGIEWHGPVSQPVLFDAFEKADVLVFPSLSDGFGMVVSEAMSRGLPVITTEKAGAADLVTRDNGLIVPAADSGALAGALQWCLDNRRRLQDMRHHALATARRRQWSDFRRELIEGLDTALRRRGYTPSFGPLDRVGATVNGR